MSTTNSFKRLSVKMKRSISAIPDVFDGYESSDKENESPDHFSTSYVSLAPSDLLQLSPARESHSRRKKLMGSLRRIGSLRTIRASPLKEKGKQLVEDGAEPKQGPRTPTLVMRHSLALNFQQSPPDQPMFDVIRRKNSVSSSLVVQRSSPVPIPTRAKQEESPFSVPVYPIGPIPETVPGTPGPLQLALERETHSSGDGSDSSPEHPQQGDELGPMPSPMPGTNLGFSSDDLTGNPQRQHEASSSQTPSEPSSCFSIPVVKSSTRTDSSKVNGVADQVVYTGYRDNTVSTINASAAAAGTVEADMVARHQSRTHECVRYNHHHHNNHLAHNGGAERTVCAQCRFNGRECTVSATSPLNIENAVYKDYAGVMLPEHRTTDDGYFSRLAKDQIGLQMQSHLSTMPGLPSFHNPGVRSAPPQNTWGTNGSLYDGTGYGGSSGSTSGRPSTESLAPEAHTNTVDDNYTVASLARDSVAMAQEYESMDEVNRAYAAMEGRGMCSISENGTEDFVAETQADVALAKEIADHSLGA